MNRELVSVKDLTEDAKVGGNGDNGDDETIKKSPFKKLSGLIRNLTSLHSNADSIPFKKRRVSPNIVVIVQAFS